MPSTNVYHRTASEVFEDACKSLRSSLSEDEQRALGSYKQAENMLESIKQLVQEHPVHHSRPTTVCKRIEKFASRLESFFEVISIFVQTNPEYSGLVWGSIRLVFLVRLPTCPPSAKSITNT
jgi:membrane protein insertase Oxa1/YidC/SpoIIIJ